MQKAIAKNMEATLDVPPRPPEPPRSDGGLCARKAVAPVDSFGGAASTAVGATGGESDSASEMEMLSGPAVVEPAAAASGGGALAVYPQKTMCRI